jgi:hypothetical protein
VETLLLALPPILYIILSMTMFPAVAILGSLFKMIRGDSFLNTPNVYDTWTALTSRT